MPRYVVERSFAHGLNLAATPQGADHCLGVVRRNEREGVTWLHSYVSSDHQRSYCVYDAPDPEAIRRSASHNDLPVDRITQVRVLDPYFHH